MHSLFLISLGIFLVNWFWYTLKEIGDILRHWKGNVIRIVGFAFPLQMLFCATLYFILLRTLLFFGFIKSFTFTKIHVCYRLRQVFYTIPKYPLNKKIKQRNMRLQNRSNACQPTMLWNTIERSSNNVVFIFKSLDTFSLLLLLLSKKMEKKNL